MVLRGSTDSILDDLERAVDDGVNTYKVISAGLNICFPCLVSFVPNRLYLSRLLLHIFSSQAMCRDSRIVPGAAATEIELAQRLKEYANAEIGYFLLLIFSDDIILGNFSNIIHVQLLLWKTVYGLATKHSFHF